jgi:cell division protein FtsL
MAKNKKRKIFLYIFLTIFFLGVIYLIFNERGLIKYFKLENEINTLNDEITRLQIENDNLKNEID